MEKINLYKQETDLIDGLLAIVNSAKKILLAIKYSNIDKPTKDQLHYMNFFNIPYTANTSREQAEQLIELKNEQLLNSLKDIRAGGSKGGKNDSD